MSSAAQGLPSDPSQNQGPTILGATLTVVIAATILVAARLYVRIFMIRSLGWDDALMVLALSVTMAGEGVVIAEVQHGAGRHLGDIPPDQVKMGMKLNFVTQPIFLFAICIVKLSVGTTLLRIATSKFFRVLIMSVMGFMAFYTVGCFFTIIFQCTDIRVQWDFSVHSVCWGKETLQALSYTNTALNILTDLLFAVFIPVPMLWSLNVNSRTRASLLGILGLGVFGCAAALTKTVYLTNYGVAGDWMWDSRNITIWTIVECCMGMIAASLPSLRPLVKDVLHLGSSYSRRRKNGTGAAAGNYYRHYGHGYGRGTRTGVSGRSRPSAYYGDETSGSKSVNYGSSRHNRSNNSNSNYGMDSEYEDGDGRKVSWQWPLTNRAVRVGGNSASSPEGDAIELETSSQKALKGDQIYEMPDRTLHLSGPVGGVVVTEVQAERKSSSESSLERAAVQRQGMGLGGITKTTTTTMTYLEMKGKR